MKIIDLSHLIHENMPVFPGTEKPTFINTNTIKKDGFRECKMSMYSHTGTHIDAPAHMLKDGTTLDKVDISNFVGSATILDFSSISGKEITLKMIKEYESVIKTVDFIILKTGFYKYWSYDRYFEEFPYLSDEAALWLSSFPLKGVGVDAISIDNINSTTFNVHNYLMRKKIIIIENLTNLDSVESENFLLSVLPLKHNDADGSPVRAVAMEY